VTEFDLRPGFSGALPPAIFAAPGHEGLVSMWITLPEAVGMYARAWRTRYGTAALKMVREKAQDLKQRGDLQGHEVWSEVARQLEHPVAMPRPETGKTLSLRNP
jgi:hypothetical protein